MLTLNDGRSELWQWDTGRTINVPADCSQVHFSNKVFGRSIDVNVIDGVANIPDILLQTDKELTAWAFVGTAENGYTKISKIFKVNKRNKPADYVFTPVEQTTLAEIVERLENIESTQDPDAIKNAVEDYLADHPIQIDETDPTVPDWAKQPEKPIYTAEEVGALPSDTPIPDAYILPIATAETLGGVKPVAVTADMTQPVGVDAEGALFTTPGASGGSSCDFPKLIARVITETDLDTIEIEGLNSTAAALSVRLYKTGAVTGNGICLAINGKQVSGAIGTQTSENDVIPGVQMWIIRRGDDVIAHAHMANQGLNNYEFKEFGNSTPIESIAVWSLYHIADATKYYAAGTIVEIYEGVYPNVK